MVQKHKKKSRAGNFCTPNGKMLIKDEPVTPKEDFGDHKVLDYPLENRFGGPMRKSMSMNDISALLDAKQGYSVSDDANCRPKRQENHSHELSKTKFDSMGEAINHFQRDTLGLSHSTRPQVLRSQALYYPSGQTRPQSPVLRCKVRTRTRHIMSQKEKEEIELEELKKFKIKARPIPKSVYEGFKNIPEVPKKPITVPEPFNLTEVHKKLPEPCKVPAFKARPAPKFHYKKPTDNDHYKKPKNNDHYKKPKDSDKILKPVEKQQPQRQGPVKPEPFSFLKYDEERRKCKEERIKKQIEEERKQASSFKAQPIPRTIKKRIHSATTKGKSSTTSSENKENCVKFEAKPPIALYKQPFKSILEPSQSVKPAPYQLETEKRAAERDKFDKQLKQKEQEMERLRQQHEKKIQEAEERAQAELRTELVHHAMPVPAFEPFIPKKFSTPNTVPETPKFVRRLKQN